MGVCRIFHFVMPGFSNLHRAKHMSNSRRHLLTELFVLKKIMNEEPPGGGLFKERMAHWKAEFAKKSAELVELELAAYRRKFYG